MDQTPVFFTSHSKQILEIRGVKTITIRTSTQDTIRATFAVTVCVDRTKVLPMLVFKGKQNGRIAWLSVLLSGECMDGWGCKSRVGWKSYKTIHCNSTRKCCSTANVGFLPMSHHHIGCKFNSKFLSGSWVYPWWMFITLSACWCWK